MSNAPPPQERWAERSFRRVLIDTHIPDWDPNFLAKLNAPAVAEAVLRSGAQAAMVYFQSHVGLCNWPSAAGQMHRGIADKEYLTKLVATLHARDIPVCAYFSVHFDNWAYLAHPEWRFEQATRNGMGPLPLERYGLCCSNNPGYRAYVRAQTEEIATAFAIDAIFFDMMWQPGICACRHCRVRFSAETGREWPDRLHWEDENWCAFHAARERWTAEWAHELRALVRSHDTRLDVYHNFAMGVANWSRAQGFESASAHDFLGGDFYGGRDEQLVVCKLMLNLSERRPIEFMTTVTSGLTEHETLKGQEELDLLAMAAVSHGAAFLGIAAFDPDGAINEASLDMLQRAFERMAPYEPYLGGAPLEEIGVYFSSASKVRFDENGTRLDELATSGSSDYPHFHAVKGACRALQGAHLAFGVITRRQIDALARYKLIVLPNVVRMDEAECAALRAYVAAGGRLYASRLTSLVNAAGRRGGDFALSDLFGAHFAAEERGQSIYVEPTADIVGQAIAPQRRLAHLLDRNGGAVRLKLGAGRALASLTLPTGHPERGRVEDHNWSSIHSSPPQEACSAPTLVRHRYGAGEVIFSAADIEARPGASSALFVALVRDLLGAEGARISCEAPPCVWMNAFEQDDRTIVTLLNYQIEAPILPIDGVRVTMRAPPGRRVEKVTLAPAETPLGYELTAEGVRVEGLRLEMFAMLIVHYGREGA